jgi:hypothetical protein
VAAVEDEAAAATPEPEVIRSKPQDDEA